MSSASTALSELTLANETEHVNSVEFELDKYIDALYEKRFFFFFLFFYLFIYFNVLCSPQAINFLTHLIICF